MQPLPGGKLPADQTVEGGAQIRVTPQGFTKLTSLLPGLINQSLTNGICIPANTVSVDAFGVSLASATYCNQNNGPTCSNGCKVGVTMNTTGNGVTVTNQQTLRMNLSTAINTSIHLNFKGPFGVNLGSCDLGVSSNNLNGSFDIAFGIKPADGELDIHLANINSFSLNMNFTGCSVISDIANLLTALLDAIPNSIKNLLTPLIDPLIQNFLPNPLGVKGMVDVGSLLEGVSPGTEGLMESRIVPGGYVNLSHNGMSLGVITGMNADEDISTRTGMRPDGVPYISEPALCVPPLPAPNYSAPPASLGQTTRSTFKLDPAAVFAGTADPANTDLAMGISETFLDLAGHHLVTSGTMCLGVGTSYINQLNVGTIGILVPSLADLASEQGNDPLLLVTRPQKDVDFAIGDNTAASPALSIGLNHMEVDFYAFLYERYVRAFTLDLTMNIGVNLEFEQMPGMPTVIKPTLVGISASQVQLKVLNSDFVRETPQHLEMVLPSVFDLVTPLLGNLPPIQVPSFAGFSLSNLSIQHVTTSEDDFLALYANLGPSFMMRQLALKDQFAAQAVDKMDAAISPQPPQAHGRATLRAISTPTPDKIRASLTHKDHGAMPEVTFDVDRFDALGRPLEWAYNINGGMFHPYVADTLAGFVVRDPAFAWQGKYEIGLKSRVKGDYRTVSEEIHAPVIIDSVGPRIFDAKTEWNDDDELTVPLFDIVSEKHVEFAFGKPDAKTPATAWTKGATASLDRGTAEDLAVDGKLAVFAKDEVGNTTIAIVAPFHGQPGGAGCACDSSGSSPSTGSMLLVLVVGGALALRRRVRWHRVGRAATTFVAWMGASAVMSMQPGCSCGSKPADKACEVAADCGEDFCAKGELPYCIDNTCVCSDDIVPGRIGPYSDVATGGGQIWVSAYAQSHGDLVVANVQPGRVADTQWEWVDGIPDGPVVVPDSKIRGGIDAGGPDVGMYTSIAVTADGTPMVTYFDRDTASLKFAAKVAGTWQIHTVDMGTGTLGESGALVGMYSSISLRTDDGRPGVAYLAHVIDAQGARAEVRYAAAQTQFPQGPGDWQTWVVDKADLPPQDPANPEIYPLPAGLGLFIDSARLPNQAPVVVYYDRAKGDLKLSKFNVATGQFAAAVTLDGSGSTDAGWSPSVAVDSTGVVHVAYVGATPDDLKYVSDAAGAMPEVIDDGYRIVGQTVDGLPKPEFHFVGDDASLVMANNGTLPMVAYQDATTQELLLARKEQDGSWSHLTIAGSSVTQPWPGAYGFFASGALTSTDIVMSTWVINQPSADPFDSNWVEVFTRPTQIQ